MNLRDAIKEQTIEYFKLPQGAEVSKELMARYMLQTDAIDFATSISHRHLYNTCKYDHTACPDDITHVRTSKDGNNNVIECGGYKL